MTQYIKRLPEVFQTVTEKKFFDATFDQVFSKKDSDLLAGYLGRRDPGSYNPISDFYLPEPSKNRTWWQLEATAYARDTDNNKTNVFFYEDMLDHIEYYGGNTLNQDRLFESQFYSFGPPIDYDMFTNYHNYYWVEQGLPTIEITGVFGADIIGKASYTTPETANPPNFTLSTGMTISLLDDAGYSTPHVVENFGNCIGIGLTNKYSDLTIGTTYEFLPWDGLTELSTGRIIYNENWDMTTWEVQAQPGNGDYITIERGAIDRNAWSRTNKWFHIDVITQTVSQTLSEFPSNATRALRPIIQFVADILLYKSGTQYRDTINLGFTDSVLGVPLTLADFQGKQVSVLDYTYDIQLVDQSLVCWFNDPATNNYIYVANVQTDGSVIFTQWTSAATPILDGDILFFKENAPDGGAQAGQTWYYESGTWQQIYSEKLGVNQPPMFVLQDHNNVSLDDPVTYPESSFRGSKIFSYKVSTATGATVDPVLKFPIVYTSLGQASDIVFQNDLITTRYNYNNDLTPIDGYYYYNVTTKPALYNSWNLFQPAPCDDTYLPPNYEFQVATAGQTAMPTKITTVSNSSNSAYLAVFVNGVFQVNGVAYTVSDVHHIDFTAPLQAGDHVSMYSYEVDASTAPRYESVVVPTAQVTVPTTVNLAAGIGGKSYTLVYVNGVYQAEVAAYNITGPNELTFVAPLAASDDVTIYSYADIPDVAPGYKSYTAIAGQTSLSTTVGFSSGVYSLVYVNGVYQAPEQAYNVSGPNQLTFVTPLTAGDTVSVYFYGEDDGVDCGENIKVSKQRVIDKYVVGYGTDYQFKLSVTPYGFPTCPDIVVSVNGIEVKNSTEQTTGYTMSTINNRIYVDLSSYLTLLLTTTQSQSPVVEIQTYTHGPLDPDYTGYSEIPQQLEANPNQLEVSDISGSNLTEHFASIIENQSSFTGVAYGGTNNYRDTRKNRSVGSYILQNVAPALKSMLVSSSTDLGFIAGVRFSEDEYTKFKNKFVSAATQLINQGFSPVQVYNNTVDISAWVGEILKVLNVSKEFSNAFAYSYMAAQGTPYASETFAVNGADLITLTDYADLTDPRNGVYLYDLTDPTNERILTVGVDYEIVSTNLTIEIQLLLGSTPVSLYTALYKSPLPIYVPSTPTKLGLYGSYIPRIELDTSYAIPTNVIIGHDGSKTIAYNDYRDNLLLDLETRIYNFLQTRYRNEYYLPVRIESVLSGKFRETRYSRDEYLNVTESYLNKWCSKNRANYRVNDWESASLVTPVDQLWKLYNYRDAVTPTGEITDLPGNWKGIFQYYYDTYHPDTRPWEMLGFSQEPSWWRTEYGAPTTNLYGQDVWTSTAAGNNVMWDDLEAGIIRQGPSAVYDWASQTPMAQEMWARPGLSAFIPVDTAGEIIPVIDLFGLAYTGNPYEPFDHYDDAWVYGDGGPVEQAWMSTSGYRFSLQEFMFLMRPGPYGELMWDTLGTTRSPGLVEIPGVAGPVMTNANWQYVQNDVFSYDDDFFAWFRPKNIDQIVHAEIVDGVTSVRFGYQSWISDRILFLGKDVSDTFGQKVRTLDVNLANKVAGFINKDTTNTYISAITPGATTNTLIIPSNNFEVFLHKSPVIDTYAYSGIIIRALADGTFAVYGYDLLNAEFITRDRSTQKLIDVSIGGTPAEFRYFERNATYQAGEYVRYNGVYYVSNAVQTVAKFDEGSWDKLSALPTEGGISVSYKPYSLDTITKYAYGSVLKTPQAVFDLMIGWGAYLESQGWQFEDVNQDTNILNDWLSSAKQFLFWVNTNWAPDASIQLSPLANSATLVVNRGYPNDVETVSNGVYSILDKYGVAISPQNTTTDRDGQSITVAPATLASGGIYFLQVNTSETEHVLVFDNETSFGDTIYSPLLRARQQRLRFYGFRSNSWYGKMEAPGYLIIDDQLVPNYDSIVNAMRYYYDSNVTIDNQSLEDLGRHLIGYESKSYLDNLEVENDVQYLFYQGVIRQKGTKQAIEKLFRSTKIQNDEIIKIYEEWALKLGDFGNTIEQVSTEFRVTPEQNTGEVIVARLNFVASTVGFVKQVNILNAQNIYTRIPTLVFPKPDATPTGAWSQWTPTGVYQIGDVVQYSDVFSNPVYRISNVDQGPSATFIESNWTTVLATRIAKAYVVLDSTNRISRVDITDPGHGYLSAPAVTISSGTDLNSLDKLYTVWQGEIVSDETLDNVINIDIDDTDVWVQRPTDPEVALEFPVTDVVDYTLPNAGYVHFDDIDLYSFDVNQTAINWQDLNPVREDTLWVAKTFTEDWDVLKLVDISYESSFEVVASDSDDQLLLRTPNTYLITPQFVDGLHGNDFGNLISLQVICAHAVAEIDAGVITDITVTQVGANYAAPPKATLFTNIGIHDLTVTVVGGQVSSIEIPEIVGVVTEASIMIAPPVAVGASTNYVVGFSFSESYTLLDPAYNYYELVTLDGTPITSSDIGEYADFTNLLMFKSMRFLQLSDMFDGNPRWDTVLWDSNLWDSGLPSYLNVGDKVWLDGYDELSLSAPKWGVFTVWFPSVKYPNGLVPFRAQEPLINTSLFENASVFNDDGTELVQLPVYDPFKYILPGAAKQNLSYVALQDPARYNVSPEARLLSSTTTFGEHEVGRLWWDLSETRYVYYEQPVALDGSETETSNLAYRRDHWAQLFPGSTVAIYEWVKSDVPPSEYEGTGIPRDEVNYVQITTSNRFTNITATSYYFWVLGSTNMPSNVNRTLAATRVASLLQTPKKQGFTFFSPIQQTSTNNAYMFYNVQEILAYQGDNVQVKYRLAERNDQEHTQWSFFREGDKTSLVADQFWDKMVDSLCGYTKVLPMSDEYDNGIIVAKNLPWDIYGWDVALWDEATDTLSAEYGEILPVPDPTLSESEKYGIMYRPRQGMFMKLYQARKIFVQAANELLKHIPIRDDNPSWAADVKTDTYWEYTNWYEIGYEDVMPTIVYRTLLEANTALTAGNLEVGTILQVINGTIDGRYVLYEVVQVNPNIAAFSLEEVAVEASAIKLLDTLYTAQNKYGLSVELRQLLNAFREEVMVNANVVDQNEVFFSMLNYVISEQKTPDWVFKTSYIYIKEDNVPLTQSTLYVPDQIDNIIDYITDVKPYHTKIRDYSTTYTISDIAVGTASDSHKWALTLTFGPNGAEDINPDHNTFDSNPAIGWDYKRGDIEIPWDYTLTSGPGVTSSGTVVTVESTTNIYPGMMVSVVAGVGEFVDNTYVTRILSETSFSVSTAPLIDLTGTLTEIDIVMPWDTTYDASFIDQFISRNAVDASYQPPTPDGIWPGFDENYIEVQLTYFDASKIGYSELFPYTFDFNGLNLNGPQTFITPSDVISVRVGDTVLNYGEDYYVEYNPEDVNYTVYFYNNPGTSPIPVAIVWLDGGAIQESYVNGYRNELAIGTSEGDMVINVDTKLPVDVSTGVATPYTGWGDTWEVIDGPVAEILLDASVGGEAEIPWDVVPELELLSYIISSKENVNRKDGAHFYRNSEVASGQLVFDVGTPTTETDNLTEITVFVDPAMHPAGTDILPTPADGYPGVLWIDGERIEYKYKGLVAPDTWELKLVRRGTMGTAANSHPALVPQVDEVNTGPAGETIYVTPTTLVPNRVWVERANSIPGSTAGPNRDVWNVYSLPAVPNPGSAQSLTAYTDVENVPIGGLWYARTPEANFLVQGMGKSIP